MMGKSKARHAAALCGFFVFTMIMSGAGFAGEVRVAPYGVTKDGRAVKAYTLVNAKGASATILDYGGAVAALSALAREKPVLRILIKVVPVLRVVPGILVIVIEEL